MFILAPIIIFAVIINVSKHAGFWFAVIGISFLETFSLFPVGVEAVAVFAGYLFIYWLRKIIEEQFIIHSAIIFLGGIWCYVVVKTSILALFVFWPFSNFAFAVIIRGTLALFEYAVLLILFLTLVACSNYIIYALAFWKKT